MSQATIAQDRPMTLDHFKYVFGNHPAGATLITADPGGEFAPVALTATSVISLSAAPPTIGFSLSSASSSSPTIRAASSVVIHFLDAESLHLAQLGATSGIDRFADERLWGRLDSGEPYFHDARVWVRGSVVDTLEVPGATVVVIEGKSVGGRAIEVDDAPSTPLVYHNRSWHSLVPFAE